MQTRNTVTAFAFVIAIAVAVGCSAGPNGNSSASVAPNSSPAPPAGRQPLQGQPIRSVDFANFTYQWVAGVGDPKKSFTLSGGEMAGGRDQTETSKGGGVALQSIGYGDVSGDGRDEALVVHSVVTGGSAIPHVVYIYTMETNGPKLLWAFSTGDRADGGLRQVYADGGELVVELYGKDRLIGGDLYGGDEALCCPTTITRARYVWQGDHFSQKGNAERLPNPEGNGPLIMPSYRLPV